MGLFSPGDINYQRTFMGPQVIKKVNDPLSGILFLHLLHQGFKEIAKSLIFSSSPINKLQKFNSIQRDTAGTGKIF